MATITRVALALRSPLHFGRRGVGLNETDVALPADSLFSALCVALGALRGGDRVDRLLDRYPLFDIPSDKVPPLRITSLMPTANGVDFLPMPLLQPKLDAVGVESRKMLKRIAWVSKSVFQKLVSGADLTEDDDLVNRVPGMSQQPFTVQDRTVWVTGDEHVRLGGAGAVLWQADTRPRVTVDRICSASAAFSSGSVHFAWNEQVRAGLYALLRWDEEDADLEQDIRSAFALLGESGIGGERSYGLGQFRPEFCQVTDDLSFGGSSYFTTLSPYLPQPAEWRVFGSHARYAIQLRRGWLSLPDYTHLRRPTIRMVGAGAILHNPGTGEATGCLADATPAILGQKVAVRRYGIAWPVPVAAAAIEGQ